MWCPPGAISTRPGKTLSPLAASRTSRWQIEFSRSANDAVNRAGMCWTSTTPGHVAGRAVSTSVSACTPPVDAPRAITLSVVAAMLVSGRGGPLSTTGRGGDSARSPTLARAAASIFLASAGDSSSMLYADPGLQTTSTAPAAMASMAVCVPSPVSELMTMTGIGRCAISLRRNVIPSIRGISMSSVSTSGSYWTILSRAMYGSAAVATTWMPGYFANSRDSICRTTAESSTISTLTGVPGARGAGLVSSMADSVCVRYRASDRRRPTGIPSASTTIDSPGSIVSCPHPSSAETGAGPWQPQRESSPAPEHPAAHDVGDLADRVLRLAVGAGGPARRGGDVPHEQPAERPGRDDRQLAAARPRRTRAAPRPRRCPAGAADPRSARGTRTPSTPGSGPTPQVPHRSWVA